MSFNYLKSRKDHEKQMIEKYGSITAPIESFQGIPYDIGNKCSMCGHISDKNSVISGQILRGDPKGHCWYFIGCHGRYCEKLEEHIEFFVPDLVILETYYHFILQDIDKAITHLGGTPYSPYESMWWGEEDYYPICKYDFETGEMVVEFKDEIKTSYLTLTELDKLGCNGYQKKYEM